LRVPVLVVNFKVYEGATGKAGLALARTCAAVADEAGASIVICPPIPQLAQIAAAVRIPVFAQHVDPLPPGSVTGHLPPHAALASGAAGTLLNHAEHKVKPAEAARSVEICRRLGLEVIACAENLAAARRLARLEPEFVAVEPPELIGGKISVTSAKPGVVEGAVAAVHEASPHTQVLCGAGVKGRKDVRRALELGTVGVLLASGVVLAKDPGSALRDLVAAF